MAEKKSGLDINRNIIEENNKMISKYIYIDRLSQLFLGTGSSWNQWALKPTDAQVPYIKR